MLARRRSRLCAPRSCARRTHAGADRRPRLPRRAISRCSRRTRPRHEVVAQMQQFTRALGVQCTYCHVEQTAPLLSVEEAAGRAGRRRGRAAGGRPWTRTRPRRAADRLRRRRQTPEADGARHARDDERHQHASRDVAEEAGRGDHARPVRDLPPRRDDSRAALRSPPPDDAGEGRGGGGGAVPGAPAAVFQHRRLRFP